MVDAGLGCVKNGGMTSLRSFVTLARALPVALWAGLITIRGMNQAIADGKPGNSSKETSVGIGI